MKHLGDITKMTMFDTPVVNCVTFGSPCQDLSVAGKRAGLAGERSGLFMDAVRVIKEMRLNSFGVYPRFAVWENVPGAFSSNGGEDFRAVLEELARIKEAGVSVPRPEKGKWAKAGVISGDGYSIAWRTIDAQYWGVPQRRRRIAVVVDLGGQCAGEVLFECKGLPGYSEPSVPAWKGIARNPADCAAGYASVLEESGECLTPWDVQSRRIYNESGKWPAIYAGEGGGHGYVMCIQGNIVDRTENSGANGIGVRSDDVSYTLNTADRHVVCYPINDKATRWMGGGSSRNHDGSGNGLGIGSETDPMFTLTAGDHHAVCCLINDQGGQSINVEDGEVSPTLRAESHAHEPVVVYRASGQANAETLVEISQTLNCDHEQPIVFESHSQDARYTQQGDTSPACTAQWGTGGNNMPLVAEPIKLRWIVRRLTPTECERLQGFPDGWTEIGEWVDEAGKKHKPADSPRYKALGNSIALPQWWWLTCKMAKYLPEHATLGSLFDGIGGFPLVWETYHGKGTAVWASEIEQFPIAVTKKHFSEEE